jgi:hypothetical protein
MERIRGMMLAQAANPSSTRTLLIEAASCSEAAVTKMITNPPATLFLNKAPPKKISVLSSTHEGDTWITHMFHGTMYYFQKEG